MTKSTRKKPATGAARGAKVPSAYKSREAEGKAHANDAAFDKAFGKGKTPSRKG